MLRLQRSGSAPGNLWLDNTTILDIVGDSCKTSSGRTVTISEAALIRKYDLQECPPAQTDHDYCDAPNIVVLSEYKSAAISYIAGYVAHMTEKKIICSQCSSALKALNQKPLEGSKRVCTIQELGRSYLGIFKCL